MDPRVDKHQPSRLFPSKLEGKLLRAALAEGPSALEAWQDWHQATDVETLENTSQRLLPLLYQSLKREGVADPALGRYLSIYKRTWYRNQLALHALGSVLRHFESAEISTLVLKGVVLALEYYRDVGLRPMEDFDVLVPFEQRQRAIQRLGELGYQPALARRLTRQATTLEHGWTFRHGPGANLDLHWYASADGCRAEADRSFWENAVPFTIQGITTQALDPTALLAHTLVHAYASHSRVIHWIADAALILQRQSEKLDWQRFGAEIATRRMLLPVRRMLAYLEQSELAHVPKTALASLRGEPTLMERAEYAHRESHEPYSLPNKVARLWFWNWRHHAHATPLATLYQFPSFLVTYLSRGAPREPL